MQEISLRYFLHNDKSTLRSGAHLWALCAHRNLWFRYAHFYPNAVGTQWFLLHFFCCRCKGSSNGSSICFWKCIVFFIRTVRMKETRAGVWYSHRNGLLWLSLSEKFSHIFWSLHRCACFDAYGVTLTKCAHGLPLTHRTRLRTKKTGGAVALTENNR